MRVSWLWFCQHSQILATNPPANSMDKKAKKRIELLNKKLHDIQQRLAGARKQMDDESEVRQLEADLAATKAEIEKLKAS